MTGMTLDYFKINIGEKYSKIYEYFKKKYGVSYPDLFTIAVSIGVKRKNKKPIQNKKLEFNSSYLKEENLFSFYTLLMNEGEIINNMEKIQNIDFIRDTFRTFEEYAEGGMEIIAKEVFSEVYNLETMNFDEVYDVDFINYLNELLQEED